jgi:Kdo2-lipid IVA lauroyltransferase/acyltransferase
MPPMFLLRQIKNRLIYLATKGAVSLIGRVPERWMPALGRGLGALAYAAAGFERRCACRQLRSAFGSKLSVARSRRLTRGVFNRLALSAVELARMVRNFEQRPNVVLPPSSLRALDEASALGRGVIFVTAHLGNWELMAATLARAGYPIFTVAKKSYDPGFTKMIHKARGDFGVRAIYRGDKGASAAMLRALRNNAVLGFLIDQDTDVPSVFAPFFGRPAKTPAAPAVLALRLGAPIVVGSIFRNTRDGSHAVEIEPFEVSGSVEEVTAALNLLLETRIRRHPCEWVWFHRRWKSAERKTEAA